MKRLALLIAALAATLIAGLALTGPSAAMAATAPTVVTGAASAVTPASATVSGTVNLNGSSLSLLSTSTCYVQYGTSTSAETTQVACPTTPAASGTTTETVNLAGLTGGTTYDFQLEVVYGGGALGLTPTPVGGGDLSFTTPSTGVLPSVATVAASGVSGASAIINGTVNPENYPVTSCIFTYGPSGGVTRSTPCTSLPSAGAAASAVSAPLLGLGEGTAYTYSLAVVYGSGTPATASSATAASFTTTAATISTPQAVTATSAALAGTVNPEGQSVTSCTFYYGTSASSLITAPCSQSVGSISGSTPVHVSVTVSGLQQKAKDIDTIVLVTAQGQAVAAAGSFTTLAAPAGTTTRATGVTATTATLHATVNAGGEGVTACAFEWGVNALTSSSSPGSDLALVEKCSATPPTGGNQGVTVTLRGLAPHTKYYDRVLLTTYGGYVIANTVAFTTPATTSPPTLKITAATISPRTRAARFRFARTGSVLATRGFQCSLVTVTQGRTARPRYTACTSGRTYTELKATTYVFSARARGASGPGAPVSRRFTI